MPTVKPYSGLSTTRLTNLINKDNGTKLRLGRDFTFGPIASYNDANGRNTRVTLTPTIGSPYLAPQEVHYWRLGLDALTRLPAGSLGRVQIQELPFSIHDLLPQINTALGLDLTADEVENTVHSVQQAKYRITIKPNASYAWLPSYFDFDADIVNIDPDLGSVILNTLLPGFDYERPPLP